MLCPSRQDNVIMGFLLVGVIEGSVLAGAVVEKGQACLLVHLPGLTPLCWKY